MAEEKHDPYAALRVDAYRKYILGWFIAVLGTRIQSIAIGWEMYQRTGEALSLGLVGLMQAIPTILFALPAGYLADRFNRRNLMVWSLAGVTLSSLGLAALSYLHGPTNLMYALLFVDTTFLMIGRPARIAMVPQLVPRAVFPNAVTWNMSLMQITSVVGPALGGFILVWSVQSAYLICAGGSLLFIVWLLQLDFQQGETRRAEPPSVQTLMAGVQFLMRERVLLVIISLDLFAVLLGGAVFLLPIYANDILKVGAQGFGWLNAAPAVGSLLMALVLSHATPMRHAGRNLLLSVAGFGVATIIFGLSQSFWLSLFMLFLTGVFDNVSVVIRHTMVQLLTPDHMRGRVSAVNSVFIGASNDLGGLESGVVAHWFGPVASVVSGGIGTLVVVAVMGAISPRLRALGALNEIKPTEEGEKEKVVNAPV